MDIRYDLPARPSKAQQKFEEAMGVYMRNLKALGRSKNTLDRYDQTFRAFTLYMMERPEGWKKDITFTDIMEYRDYLLTKNTLNTTKQRLLDLRRFYIFASSEELGDERWFDKNPVSTFLIPKVKYADKKPYDIILKDEEVERLIPFAHKKRMAKSTEKLWIRDHTIVILMLETNIRTTELTNLTPNDILWDEDLLLVRHGKGDKYREVDLSEFAKSTLRLYFASGIRPDYAKDTDPIFGSKTDSTGRKEVEGVWHKFSRQFIGKTVQRFVQNTTGVDKVRGHDLRHVGSRLDLYSGMRMEELQAKLGHESITTTQIYSGKLGSKRRVQRTKMLDREREKETRRNELRLERMKRERESAQIRMDSF